MRTRSFVLVLVLALPSARAQMSMGPEEEEMLEAMGIKGQPMGRKNLKPQAEIFKKDLKFIHCNVCRQMVDISLGKAAELLEKRFQFQKKRKHDSTEFDGEFAVQEYVEKIWCAARAELAAGGMPFGLSLYVSWSAPFQDGMISRDGSRDRCC